VLLPGTDGNHSPVGRKGENPLPRVLARVDPRRGPPAAATSRQVVYEAERVILA